MTIVDPSARATPRSDPQIAAVFDVPVRRWGIPDELVLRWACRGEGHHLNWAAALDCLGCLQSRSVVAGDVEVCPGDRVVVGPSGIGRPGGSGIPEGWPGDVRLVLRADDCGEVYPRLAEPGEVANARLRTVEDPDHVDFLDAELAERLPDLAVAQLRDPVLRFEP